MISSCDFQMPSDLSSPDFNGRQCIDESGPPPGQADAALPVWEDTNASRYLQPLTTTEVLALLFGPCAVIRI